MIKHKHEIPNDTRFQLLNSANQRIESDGLNSLTYILKKFEELPLFTHITVEV